MQMALLIAIIALSLALVQVDSITSAWLVEEMRSLVACFCVLQVLGASIGIVSSVAAADKGESMDLAIALLIADTVLPIIKPVSA